MNDYRSNDPFATPGPDGQQWQGTPVPMQPVPLSAAPPAPMIPPPPHLGAPPAVSPNPAYGAVTYPPVPPAGYMYAANYTGANTSKNWMGIVSLVLSVLTPALGITFIPGIIFGHMGLSAVKKGEANNGGLALAGVIVGWVVGGIGLLVIAFAVIGIMMDPTTLDASG